MPSSIRKSAPGEKTQNERLPCHTASKKTISISLDGVPAKTLFELIDSGRMPNVRDYFAKDKSLTIRNAISTFPSLTTSAHTALMTGLPVNESDITGLKWYDRLRDEFVNSKSPIIGLKFKKYVKGKTIFENERNSLVYGEFIHKGARRWVFPAYNPFLGKTSPLGPIVESRILERIPTKLNKYDLVHIWWYSSDQVGHHKGKEYLKKNLETFDKSFGKMVKKIDPAQTTVAIYADHGMRNVNNREIELVGTMAKAGYRPAKNHKIKENNELIFTFDETSFSQIYAKSDSETGKIVDTISSGKLPGIDFIMYRDYDGGYGEGISGINVLKQRTTGKLERAKILSDGKNHLLKYVPVDGGDPLDLAKIVINQKKKPKLGTADEGWASGDEWLSKTYNARYPDAVERIAQLFGSRNAGNVVLTSQKNYYFSESTQDYSVFSGYETDDEKEARVSMAVKKMTHGSLEGENMRTAILARGPYIKPEIREYGRIEEVYGILSDAARGTTRPYRTKTDRSASSQKR